MMAYIVEVDGYAESDEMFPAYARSSPVEWS